MAAMRARAAGSAAFIIGMIGVALAGCAVGGLSEETSNAVYGAPGKYNHLNCRDLEPVRKGLVAREKELRELREKAAASPGGAMVNSIAYDSDYRQARASLVLLEKAEVEKKCELPKPPGT